MVTTKGIHSTFSISISLNLHSVSTIKYTMVLHLISISVMINLKAAIGHCLRQLERNSVMMAYLFNATTIKGATHCTHLTFHLHRVTLASTKILSGEETLLFRSNSRGLLQKR